MRERLTLAGWTGSSLAHMERSLAPLRVPCWGERGGGGRGARGLTAALLGCCSLRHMLPCSPPVPQIIGSLLTLGTKMSTMSKMTDAQHQGFLLILILLIMIIIIFIIIIIHLNRFFFVMIVVVIASTSTLRFCH